MRRIAIAQMGSGPDLQENLAKLKSLFAEAHHEQANLLVLPENFAFMGIYPADKLNIAEQPGDGLIQNTLRALAAQYALWVVAGTIPIKAPDGRVWASSLVLNAAGEVVTRYDKIHLFDVM